MFTRKFQSIFPLPIAAYGVSFIFIGLLICGGFSYLTLHDISVLQHESKQRNLQLAQKELQDILDKITTTIQTAAKSFAEWDETLQQLNNTIYYSYWLKHRVPSTNFLPSFFVSLKLYDKQGKSIGRQDDIDFPAEVSLPTTSTSYIKKIDQHYLFYFQTIFDEQETSHIVGYLIIKIDFNKAINHVQQFKYINIETLTIATEKRQTIDTAHIAEYILFKPIPNIEFNKLQDIMFETLQRFTFIGAGLALLFLYLSIMLFALPARKLSHQIDALRQGKINIIHPVNNKKLAVAEFEKIRLSLNDYQIQLDRRDAALRESEMRMRAVLNNVVDGIITINQQGIIESFNLAAQRIFSLQTTDVYQRNMTSLLSSTSQQKYHHYWEHCNKTTLAPDNKIDACELTGIANDGTSFPIEIALSNMLMDGVHLSIIVVRDITERKQSEEKLIYLANYDELTGLPNRTLFRNRLTQAMARAKRHEHLIAVIFIDLDHFKNINDTLGHHIGDQLLINASHRLSSCIREVDTVARLGGDEFMIVLEMIKHVDEISTVASKLLHTLDKPFTLEGNEVFVGASAGITIYPFDDIDIDNLIKNADTAMYKAKEQGRNTYQYYTADMNTKNVERLTLESALRHALARNEFELYYQPRVDLITNCTVGMEALLRWQHPKLGNISPARFIPVLEETGLIVPVGEWVLETACRQTLLWHNTTGLHLRIAVNLSTRQFRQKNIIERFCHIVKASGLAFHFLELEITEGMLVESVDSAIQILQAFHDTGIHLSVDDFGTGYSSLSYLKRFPITTLKIDQSFIRDLPEDTDDAAITSAIVALARNLKLNVTAEGIETEAQLNFIKDLGCDEAQGYYFSKPLPANDFQAFITQPKASIAN